MYATIINIPADQPTIQAGIDVSFDGDTVLVQPNTYVENINYNGKNITVASLYIITQDTAYISNTIIDGSQNDIVARFENNEDYNATLDGFTIRNGSGYYAGGIICYEDSNPTIKNLNISQNVAEYGGGITINNSNPTLLNVTISNNSASVNGGGIRCIIGSNPIITNSIVISNSASYQGGGIYCEESSPILDSLMVSGNITEYGSGICCRYFSSPQIFDCTISMNVANQAGGGINCYLNSSPTIVNCSIFDNVTGDTASNYGFGGGINCNNNSSPTISNCDIFGNVAKNAGGGIDCNDNSSPTISYCNIYENTTEDTIDDDGFGGGISNKDNSSPTISNCSIIGNTAISFGGRISCFDNSNPIIENVVIESNISYYAGGIQCAVNSSPIISNCLITNNIATNIGAGISCYVNSSPEIINCTISENIASVGGGGIGCKDNSNPILFNSVLWNDSTQEIFFNQEGNPNAITVSYSDIQGGEAGIETNDNGEVFWLEGNIDADPLFVDPENGDYHLTENSPCIDAGDPDSPFDPDGTIADMGAFYFNQNIGIEENYELEITNYELGIFPNPFQSSTTIQFTTENTGKNTEIEIYNIKGQKIKTLECINYVDAKATQSLHSIIWNGTDDSNKPVSSGIYFINLRSGKDNIIKKAVLMR